MRISLVNMPWASIDVPPIALGILKNRVQKTVPDAHVDVMHANLDFVDWVTSRIGFRRQDYNYYETASYFLGCGDWVFSSALHDDPNWRVGDFTRRYAGVIGDTELNLTLELHKLVPEFAADVARRIVDAAPDVVGFTSTFQQNAASLAVARAVKRMMPSIVTVFGGANFDGVQGEAFHRNFDFIDYVVRGEGEVAFPALLTALPQHDDLTAIAGLCWRRDGSSVANPMATTPLPPNEIEAPDFDGYFEALRASEARGWVEPRLVLEGSRGCWWGEKHHCTFCGLNGSMMQYRSKTPERFYEELLHLVSRHHVLDVFLVDDILDMSYLKTVLPRLADAGYDLRLEYEIKANMRRDQVETLSRAGLVHVQPGVENLCSHVLKLMDKGVSGCHNVRILRDAESAGVSISWNYLYGFPGETVRDYLDVVDQMPALHHLAPPDGSNRIQIERFSPYFDQPALGFADKRPHPQYGMVYDLPESELFDLAYLFDATPRGIDEQTAATVGEAVTEWQESYSRSRLTYCDLGNVIVLVNHRHRFPWDVLRIDQPLHMAAFRQLHEPRRPAALARDLGVDEPAITDLLQQWRSLGIVFHEGGHVIQLAGESNNQEVLHLGSGVDRLRAQPRATSATTRSMQ